MTNPKENLIGKKFGKLTVVRQSEDYIEKNGKHRTMWHCKCECGNEKDILEKLLKNGYSASCGCLRKEKARKRSIDLTGKRFGRLTVIERADDRITKSGIRIKMWECLCDCGKENIIVQHSALQSGSTKSCGCLRKEVTSFIHKASNKYDLTCDYGIGYTNKGEEFYFDLEDYDKIKDYYWYKRNNGYIVCDLYDKTIHMHRLVMGLSENDKYEIDHKKDKKKYDNRKQNLRIATHSQNMRNVGIRKDNTSGVTGVDWMKNKHKWRARICVENKNIDLGYFDAFEDAVKARMGAEEEYFKEWSYKNSQK